MEAYQKLPLATVIARSVPKPFFELSEERIGKLKDFSDILLTTLIVATTLTMIVVAPNALQAFDIFYKRKGRKKLRHKEKVKKVIRAFYYLKESGWLDFKRNGDDYEIVITEKGRKKIKTLNFKTLSIAKPAAWDKRFWQVAADIPTKDNKKYADAFRRKLKDVGFYPLQRTLWFYPFDPRIEIEFISRYYGIFNFVTVMKIETLDPADHQKIKKFFKTQGLI